MRTRFTVVLVLSLTISPDTAYAEGSAQTGDNQSLDPDTLMFVELEAGEYLNVSARSFLAPHWTNYDPLYIKVRPPGSDWVQHELTPGSGRFDVYQWDIPEPITDALVIEATVSGVYKLQFSWYVAPWDISVTSSSGVSIDPTSPEGGRGRLYSEQWSFDAGTFESSGQTNSDFYVVTPAGTDDTNYVWLLDFEGLAGYIYDVAGNGLGLPPPYSRTSQAGSLVGHGAFEPEHDIFLNLPITAVGPATNPEVTFEGISGTGMTLEGEGGKFRFSSNLAGTYQVIVDSNKDGNFDPTSDDAKVPGSCVIGSNDAVWDGKDADGEIVPADTYNARLYMRIGEFHFAGWDIETARPGLRIASVNPDTDEESSTQMFWDDRAVLTSVPADDPSPAETVLDGVDSDVTRHSWGNFHSGGPGNMSYVDTWVFGAESSDSIAVEIHEPDNDADGDGINNDDDQFPCDNTLTQTIIVPAQGETASVFFEDLWPDMSDRDFNDLVVSYNYEFGLDTEGKIVVIVANYTPRALGAGHAGGFGVVIPVSPSLVSGVTRQLGPADTATSHAYESQNGGTMIRVIQETRDLFPDGSPQYINTDPNREVRPATTVAIQIKLSEGVTLPTAEAPFDLFYFRSGDFSHEIHLPQYSGTSHMDTSIFGQAVDGSNESAGRYFVNTSGLPYGLDVPSSTQWPTETTKIEHLFPNILTFASSAGVSSTDYYENGVVSAYAFEEGASGGTPPVGSVLPTITVVPGTGCGSSCIPACTVSVDLDAQDWVQQPSRVINSGEALCLSGEGTYYGTVAVNSGGNLVMCEGAVTIYGSVAVQPGGYYWTSSSGSIVGSFANYGTTESCNC